MICLFFANMTMKKINPQPVKETYSYRGVARMERSGIRETLDFGLTIASRLESHHPKPYLA
jgi:hypothetical protein